MIIVETQPDRRTLPGGATLTSRATPGAHGVALGVMICTGTRDETGGTDGISHLLEHMVFKGTSRRTAFQLARDMEAIGAHLDAYTTKEHTGYTLMVMPRHLDQACSILAEMLGDSTFPEDQLALEKQVVVEEILSSEDSPEDHVHELFTARLLAEHPLARPILGTRESVLAISADDLRARAVATHRGGNVILAVAGAVDPEVLGTVARHFDFPAGSVAPSPQRPASPRPGVVVAHRDLAQEYVEIGIPIGGMSHPDRYAATLVGSILGGGMSSRLFQSVREERGLAYSIYSYADYFKDVGTLCTSFSASPENAQPALDLVAAEYGRLQAGDIDDAEVEMNKAQMVGSVVLGLEGSMNQMARLGRNELYFDHFLSVDEIVGSIERLTRHDVLRVAAQALDFQKQTVVGYGPVPALTAIG